jgi:hypothetical protein
MLIDEFMPEYQFSERHAAVVPAPVDAVRRAVDGWRPADSFLWRWLLRLRGLGRPAGSLRQWAEGTGFFCLADTENEIVYGLAGRFWSPNERGALVSPKSVEEFLAFNDPRSAVGVMNLLVEQLGPARTRLYTETRVRALGRGARRRFRLYWTLIRPFSGLLRKEMLNSVKRAAIKAHHSASARKETHA